MTRYWGKRDYHIHSLNPEQRGWLDYITSLDDCLKLECIRPYMLQHFCSRLGIEETGNGKQLIKRLRSKIQMAKEIGHRETA